MHKPVNSQNTKYNYLNVAYENDQSLALFNSPFKMYISEICSKSLDGTGSS